MNLEKNNEKIINFLINKSNIYGHVNFMTENFGNNSINALKIIGENSMELPINPPSILSVSFEQETVGQPTTVIFTGNIINNGGSEITEMGVVYSSSNANPTISDSKYTQTVIQSGVYTVGPGENFGFSRTYARAYAINNAGISYGSSIALNISLCLAKGTMISLAKGIKKPIENIEYTDLLSVWDFDNCCFSSAFPLWIMSKGKTVQYNLLKFSDGSELKTIKQHRIFNKEFGRFTHPMTDDTPVGTSTFNEKQQYIKLVSKEIVQEEIEYYNVITYKHINLFANGILTSSSYNNLYPIKNMKFIKDIRVSIPKSVYYEISEQYYYGLRLAEQKLDSKEIIEHIKYLETRKK